MAEDAHDAPDKDRRRAVAAPDPPRMLFKRRKLPVANRIPEVTKGPEDPHDLPGATDAAERHDARWPVWYSVGFIILLSAGLWVLIVKGLVAFWRAFVSKLFAS